MERTEAEAARLARLVDGLPVWKTLQVMNDTVGSKRSVELMGWVIVWGLQGETSGVALRNKLQAEGMTQRSAYRAIDDFRRVADALLALPEYEGSDVFESLRRLAGTLSL